ncbi:MAG: GNAT family N-acetyltransferase, partial [Cyanobacteria bacterium J06598_3]
QIVGIAIARFSLFSAPWIQAVFTHPEFVYKGVGRALVNELERRATLRNSKKLLVMSSLTAVGFYEALYYQRLADTVTVGNNLNIKTSHEILTESISTPRQMLVSQHQVS